jgi:hypothetical protein
MRGPSRKRGSTRIDWCISCGSIAPNDAHRVNEREREITSLMDPASPDWLRWIIVMAQKRVTAGGDDDGVPFSSEVLRW